MACLTAIMLRGKKNANADDDDVVLDFFSSFICYVQYGLSWLSVSF